MDPQDDEDEWDGPEALARWRTRHIWDLNERARAFHALWRELEEEARKRKDSKAEGTG